MKTVAYTKDNTIGEIIESNPEMAKVFMKFGMHCMGCAVASGETVAEAAQVHNIDIDELITALNDAAEDGEEN